MLIREVAEDRSEATKLAALAQFLMGRAEDTDAAKTISTTAFIRLVSNMGISVTADRLAELIQQPPLNNLIANIEGDTITFQGADVIPNTMTVDRARATVDSMAKRVAKQAM
jgi:hypothetical protein